MCCLVSLLSLESDADNSNAVLSGDVKTFTEDWACPVNIDKSLSFCGQLHPVWKKRKKNNASNMTFEGIWVELLIGMIAGVTVD